MRSCGRLRSHSVSPQNRHPKRHGAEIDRDVTSFGIRSLKFDPNEGFFLNDRRVEIKGDVQPP